MMRRSLLLCCATALALIATACGSFTRTERDVYTITHSDTVVTDRVMNQPGERDNGIVHPSTRTVTMNRTMVQTDSVVERHYPAFIRLGLFEGIGTIGSASSDASSTYTGLFGVFYDVDRLLHSVPVDTTEGALFSGYIYRMGIAEWRLRWFDDDPDWSWGINAVEILQPDAKTENTLMGFGVLTLNKRFYLSKKIPYLAIRPSVALSMFPAQFVNASVSADAGSIGGVNLRLYAGYAFGARLFSSPIQFTNFPYFGVGASVLDFLNRQEELDVEWKYHEHSAWEVGLVDFVLLGSNAEFSAFAPEATGDKVPVMKGGTARVAYAAVALPVLDYRLSLGTTLFNTVFLGRDEYGIGFFPLRLSYHLNPFGSNSVIEPFFEYNIAPSTFSHLGVRFAVSVGDQTSLQIVGGWVNGDGKTNFNTGGGPTPQNSFSVVYLGIGANLFDRLFGRGDLRYGKGYQHE